MPEPIYTAVNCSRAYQLNWAISLFGRVAFPELDSWIEPVKLRLEPDDIRILEHRRISEKVASFLVSTKPNVSPAVTLQRLKGRLQHAIQGIEPHVFRRNYRVESVGSAKRVVIERYVGKQCERHPMADPRIQQRLLELQVSDPEVDLSAIRYSAHGQFIYNLHLVLENEAGCEDCSDEFLRRTVDMVRRVATTKELLLKGTGIVANHLHLAFGCQMDQAPADIALSFLNNLAYAHDMQAIWKFGYYAGTFGNFDLGAIRNAKVMAVR